MTHTNHKYTNPSEFCLLLFRCITKKFQKHIASDSFDVHRNYIIHNITKSQCEIMIRYLAATPGEGVSRVSCHCQSPIDSLIHDEI